MGPPSGMTKLLKMVPIFLKFLGDKKKVDRGGDAKKRRLCTRSGGVRCRKGRSRMVRSLINPTTLLSTTQTSPPAPQRL